MMHAKLTFLYSTLLMLSILKIISVNIRRSFETKIDGIIKDYGDCEVICLQECDYIKQNVISDLENNTDFKIYFSQGELHTKGVVTLVKKNIECTNHILKVRLVHTSFKADDKVLNLLNIYSPTKSTGRQGIFYREMIEYCASEEEKRGDKREVESVLDKNGKSCTSKSEVIQVVTDIYSDLYKSQNIDRQSMTDYLEDLEQNKLTEEDKTNFDTFITQDECLKLLKEFKNNKSPGVDGIRNSFYTKFWNIIGEDLVKVLNNVYLNGELTELMKTGLISLIYKNKGNRKDLKQWRPISLLCVDYKILTKFLSKNLSKVINKLLDKNQTGAGPEKLILDNLLSIESILE
ncbi:unnamed protein product [Mytilus coruscus]|uniref:Uncharacterized protein n=1 Tax=Mytilus coruscus TaxID=42192 RepID=A0A6J8AU92_MYTCO|nr:unnamed protein product [Mytilus coruscus]